MTNEPIETDGFQPFICDGRVDEEKLLELLQVGAEHPSLDFKREIDLKDPRKKLEFIKDCAAMANQPRGGYLVIGADDSGQTVEGTDFSAQNLDSAALTQAVLGYLDGSIDIRSRLHTIDVSGAHRELAIIYVAPPLDGFPIVTKKRGDWKGAGSPVTVFYEGVVYTREGSSNALASHKTWLQILHNFQQREQRAARAHVDELIRRVVAELGPSGTSQVVTPDFEMDLPTFAATVRSVLDAKRDGVLKRLLVTGSTSYFQNLDDAIYRNDTLDRLAIVACEALLIDDLVSVGVVVDTFYSMYKKHIEFSTVGKRNAATYWLEIVIRIFAIGSLAVRRNQYTVIPTITLRPIGDANSSYKSWIRHTIVAGSNANLFRSNDGKVSNGLMISAAFESQRRIKELRPDLAFDAAEKNEAVDQGQADELLSSITQFDFLWCCVALAGTEERGFYEFYPSCALFHDYRTDPAIQALDSNVTMRRDLFGDASDTSIASAIAVVYQAARRQSFEYGGFWKSIESLPARGFILTNATTESLRELN